MRALVQKRGGEFSSVNTCAAYLGLRERGFQVEFFEAEDFETRSLDDGALVVGGVPVISRALARLGIAAPNIESIPGSLHEFARRKLWLAPIAEVRARVDRGESIFIKPIAGHLKSFAGHVAANYGDLAITAGLPEDQLVSCSEPVRMLSEYRVYVTRGAAIGCKHYWGDFRELLDFNFVEAAVAAFKGGPAGYGIDFAVTDNGETVLIEVNDGFALGSYGLQPLLYSGLLEARWQELITSRPRIGG